MISSHLFLLMLNCFLGAAASVRSMKGVSGSAQDSSFPQPSSDPFSDDLDQDMVSQHMSKLYEKCNRENRLREGNTVRSFRASQGVWRHSFICAQSCKMQHFRLHCGTKKQLVHKGKKDKNLEWSESSPDPLHGWLLKDQTL